MVYSGGDKQIEIELYQDGRSVLRLRRFEGVGNNLGRSICELYGGSGAFYESRVLFLLFWGGTFHW